MNEEQQATGNEPRFIIADFEGTKVVAREGLERKDFARYHAAVNFEYVQDGVNVMQFIGRVSDKATWVKLEDCYSFNQVSPEHSHDETDNDRILYPRTAGVPVEKWGVVVFENPETGEWE